MGHIKTLKYILGKTIECTFAYKPEILSQPYSIQNTITETRVRSVNTSRCGRRFQRQPLRSHASRPGFFQIGLCHSLHQELGSLPYFWNLSWPRDMLYVLYMAEMTCVASKARPEASLQLLLSPSWDVSLRSLKRSNLLEDEGLQGEPKCPSGQSPTGRPVREAVTDHPARQTL